MPQKGLFSVIGVILVCLFLSSCTFVPAKPPIVITRTQAPTSTSTQTVTPTPLPSSTPNPTATPTPTFEAEKKIVVILSQQMVYAYEGDRLVRDFIVSTGVSEHPTVQGTFYIYVKLELTRMTGEGYDLPDVPWTMYFHEGYGFHGTYWHSNFGHPMSHGCINMETKDAEWLYHWAPLGTRVEIYP